MQKRAKRKFQALDRYEKSDGLVARIDRGFQAVYDHFSDPVIGRVRWGRSQPARRSLWRPLSLNRRGLRKARKKHLTSGKNSL